MSENHKDLTPALLRAKTIIHDYQTKTGSFAPSKPTQQRNRPATRPSSAPARKDPLIRKGAYDPFPGREVVDNRSADDARGQMIQRCEESHKQPQGKHHYND